MGLQEDINHQFKVISMGRSTIRKAESLIKKAEERLEGLVGQALLLQADVPQQPAPPTPMDEERHTAALKRLRRVGYVPKIKRR